MSEEQTKSAPQEGTTAAPETAEKPSPAESKELEAPALAFVYDGTPTFDSEKEIKRRALESEARRKEDDFYRAQARRPIEQGGGVEYTNQLTDNPEADRVYAKLRYLTRRGGLVYHHGEVLECLADIIMEDMDDPNNLTLVIVCPACAMNTSKPIDSCQLKISQKNKNWYLRQRPRFEPFDDGYGMKMYPVLGDVLESEPFQCGYCHWRGVLSNNCIRTI